MAHRILVTLGQASLEEAVVKGCTDEGVYLFRLNLSHAPLESLARTIDQVRAWTDVPICLDSEGAQLRNGEMAGDGVAFSEGGTVRIHFEPITGDAGNISFRPAQMARTFRVGDEIGVDFDHASLRVTETGEDHCLAVVVKSGFVGSRKAADLTRDVEMDPLTEKDRNAVEIGRAAGIGHYALSFTNKEADVGLLRALTGPDTLILSKIESPAGVRNLEAILGVVDEILIDRGDLSRRVAIEKIPFLQRRIISMARARGKPVYVATNLMESMVTTQMPNRAEVNDVVSTLEIGADGLVLAAETAIGQYPVQAVRMVRALIDEFAKWTPNTSLSEIINL